MTRIDHLRLWHWQVCPFLRPSKWFKTIITVTLWGSIRIEIFLVFPSQPSRPARATQVTVTCNLNLSAEHHDSMPVRKTVRYGGPASGQARKLWCLQWCTAASDRQILDHISSAFHWWWRFESLHGPSWCIAVKTKEICPTWLNDAIMQTPGRQEEGKLQKTELGLHCVSSSYHPTLCKHWSLYSSNNKNRIWELRATMLKKEFSSRRTFIFLI